jgi:hypothetical protein
VFRVTVLAERDLGTKGNFERTKEEEGRKEKCLQHRKRMPKT